MGFSCAAAFIVCLVLQPLTLQMATCLWPDAVDNMSLGRQPRFPFLLKVVDEAFTGSVGHLIVQGSKVR